MCGRSVTPNSRTFAELAHKFGVPDTQNRLDDAYTDARIWPSQKAHVLFEWDGQPALAPMTWGFTPDYHNYNARVESLETKKMWSAPFQTNRCVIPIVNFLEGSHEFSQDGETMLAAGLYGVLHHGSGLASQSEEFVFTMITCDANPIVAPYHKRMPLFVPGYAVTSWIANSATNKPTAMARVFERSTQAMSLAS